MKLYHGSNVDIREIDLTKSMRGKDFGQGFYLSVDEKQAEEMAIFKAKQYDGTPIISTFEFDETVLNYGSLKVKLFTEYSLEWAEFVFANRTNTPDTPLHDHDIIYGPIADDRVGVQIRNLIEKNITLEVFLERLQYIKGITFQYYFGTERATNLLRRL